MMATLSGLACDFLGLLFVYSGMMKLRSLGRFRDQLKAFHLFPAVVSDFIAVLLPPLETATGLLLLSHWYAIWGLSAASGLLVLLTAFIAWALRKRGEVACFCFGEADGAVTAVTLRRNLVLVAAAAGGLALSFGQAPTAHVDSYRILLLGYGACAAIVFLSWFQLSSLQKELEKMLS